MAYYIGSTYDRQSRRAVIANDHGQLDSPLPLLSQAGEVAPQGDTTLSTRLPPTGYRRSRDYSWESSGPPNYLAGEVTPVGQQFTELPPADTQRPRSRDYTFIDPTEIWLIGQDAMNAGVQSAEFPPAYRKPKRLSDYSWEASSPPNYLAGEVAPAGAHSYELPPKGYRRSASIYEPGLNTVLLLVSVQAPFIPPPLATELPARAVARSRDYTWLHPTDTQLIGQDAMATGAQVTELPPRKAPRGADLSTPYNLTVWLDYDNSLRIPGPGKSTEVTALTPRGAARSRDYTFLHNADVQLFGTDAMVPGRSTFGTDLPPRGPARSRDYTWLQTYGLPIFEQLPCGAQLTGNAPRGYQRAASLYDPLSNNTLIPDFVQAQALPPGKGSRDTELSPRGYSRSRDYTFLHQADTQLFGQDAVVTGSQLSGNPPRGPVRSFSIYDPGFNFLIGLTSVQAPLSPQLTELPPRGAARSKDYSFSDQAVIPQLLGQDAVNPGKSTDATALPPRGPQRSKDYTWLQSYQIHVFEQLPPGDSTIVTEGPPKGPLRLKDYTFLNVNVRYIGQDTMYGAPGEAPTYDWPNPIPYKRPINIRDFVNPQVLFTGKPLTPGTVLAGSSLTATVLAGSSALGSVLGGASQTEL